MEEERQATLKLLGSNASGFTDEENGGSSTSVNGNHTQFTPVLACSTFVAGCGAFTYGFVFTYSAPTESKIIADLGLTVQEYSVFGSILTIGGLVGALLCGKLTDLIGRKYMTLILATVYLVGWLVISLAKTAWLLDLGRLISGLGSGIGAYLVPIYFAEVTPKNLRGGLMLSVMMMTIIGICSANLIGNVVSWRTLALLGTIPCLLQYFVLFFIPESPRWLAKIGREKEFEASLKRLRGQNADIVEELAEIKEYIDALQSTQMGRISDLFRRENAYPVAVGIGLMLLQQGGGVTGYTFYTDAIFVSAGISSSVGFAAVSAIKILLCIVAAILIDKCGRRPLLLVAVSGAFLGSLLTGLSFFLQGINWWKSFTPGLALTGVMVYMGSYGLGVGTLPWMIVSEMLPLNIKAFAGSMCNVVSYLCSWVVSYTFNFLLDWSSAGTFFIYAVINGLGFIFVAKLVPETKQRTLEEIQASFK